MLLERAKILIILIIQEDRGFEGTLTAGERSGREGEWTCWRRRRRRRHGNVMPSRIGCADSPLAQQESSRYVQPFMTKRSPSRCDRAAVAQLNNDSEGSDIHTQAIQNPYGSAASISKIRDLEWLANKTTMLSIGSPINSTSATTNPSSAKQL